MLKLSTKTGSGLLARKALFRRRPAALVAGLMAVVGIVAIVFVFAAGPFAAVEPEDGALSGSATALSVAGASGGKVVRFGSGTTPTPTPAPTPTPTPGGGTGSCALPQYPDASCTGVPAGTVLTARSGVIIVNTPNTVIENINLVGCIGVYAPGVIIRKSKITCDDGPGIESTNYTGTRLLIEDVELTCGGGTYVGTGIGHENFTARRVNLYGCSDAFNLINDVTIEDSYIHDPICYNPTTDPHTDGIQSPSGSRLLINHNTFYGSLDASKCAAGRNIGNAAININATSSGPTSTDTTISNNLLAGGGYTLYCPGSPTVNFRVLNNHFSTIFHPAVGLYGPSTGCNSNEIKSGNVYHESGQPVTLN